MGRSFMKTVMKITKNQGGKIIEKVIVSWELNFSGTSK